jgi:hypothetical protein
VRAEGDAKAAGRAPHDEPAHQYCAVQHMHAWSDRLHQEAWLDARTTLHNGHLSYEIMNERGSDTIRKKVLYAVLKREQEIVNDGNLSRGDLTDENYDFADAERSTDGTTIVPITARRKDVLLVNGRMVLDADTGDLLRVEGRLSKNPSFWPTLVQVVRRYTRLGGVRVPIATDSTAKIRFVGTARLEIRYEYQSVNGQAITARLVPQLGSGEGHR